MSAFEIGFKGLFNDMYARDISRKVRAGFLQKQKEGLVMIPPMGYFKDKNTGEITIMDEPANIVRRIFQMYLDGYGLKDMDNTIKKRKAEISSSIEIFNKIIEEGTISDSDLRMLIDKIEISETDGKLDISITLKINSRSTL